MALWFCDQALETACGHHTVTCTLRPPACIHSKERQVEPVMGCEGERQGGWMDQCRYVGGLPDNSIMPKRAGKSQERLVFKPT